MLELEQIDDTTVALSGRFDAAQVEKAKKFFDNLEDSVTVDMTHLEYISSAGLGVLVATYKRLDQTGHKVILKNLNGHISTVFRFSGLDKIFTIE